MLLSEFSETIGNLCQIGVQDIERVANLEYAASVNSILACGAEVDERRRVFIGSFDVRGELFQERNGEVSGKSGVTRDRGKIVRIGLASSLDRWQHSRRSLSG